MGTREFSVPCIQSIEKLREISEAQGFQFSYSTRPDIYNRKPSNSVQGNEELEYEVEKIVDHATDPMNNEWFLVKWKGWPSSTNSWEPLKNLTGSKDAITEYRTNLFSTIMTKKLQQNKKLGTNLSSFLEIVSRNTASTICALSKSNHVNNGHKNGINGVKKLLLKPSSFKKNNALPQFLMEKWKQFEKVQKQLKEWERQLNAASNDEAEIIVENLVDFEGPPQDFTYINDYKPAAGITIPDDPFVGCECTDCYSNRKNCCSHPFEVPFAYNKYRKVNVTLGSPIYECNKRCKCPPDCINRVVQHGRKVKLAIFRTSNGCGWGVKALQHIRQDSFVMEYVGEVITNEEAEIRGKKYDNQGRTYLFDLDYDYKDSDTDCPFTVDAATFGNVSHFINHSCEPNLVVYSVWINNLDPRMPRLAFFSNKDIKKGEELTFDYKMTKENESIQKFDDKSRIECKCGAPSCRKYLC